MAIPALSLGQCPAPAQLQEELRSIQSLPYEKQNAPLRQWCSRWTKCGYPKDSSYVDALLQLGLASMNRGIFSTGDPADFVEAARFSQKVVQLHGQSLPRLRHSDLAKAYYRQGVALRYLEEEEKSTAAFQQAVRVADTTSLGKQWASNAHLYLAFHYFARGDYQKALANVDRGEQLARQIQDVASISKLLMQKGQTFSELKRYDEAINALQEAIDIIKQDPRQQPSMASQYRLLGHLYQKKQQKDKAIACLTTALKISQELNYKPYDFAASLGYLYYTISNYPQALRYYRIGLASNPDPASKSLLLDNLGAVYWKMKQFHKAFSYYQLATSELVPGFRPAYVHQHPSAKAMQQSPEKVYLLTILLDKADTWLDYYQTHPIASGTKAEILQNALRSYALADSVIDFMRYQHEGEESRLFWRNETHGLYERALRACYLAGDARQAFYFLEKSKSVLLADKLNELGANRQLSDADARQQRALRDSLFALQSQLYENPGQDERYSLQKRLDKTSDEFEQFRKKIEKTNPAYYRYRYDNHTPTLAEFRQNLASPGNGEGGGAAFVSYFVGDSTLYAYVLTQQQARLVRLAIPPARYEASAGEFLKLCSSRAYLNAHYARYQSLAHELYQQLWEPLKLTASRVVIAPDGMFLPFEALLTRAGSDDFLLKQCAISYTYSARFLQITMQGQEVTFDHSFVGFAPENFKASTALPSLRGSADALEAVGRPFWFGKSLINAEASKANFLRYAPGARVIQLFTHAAADSTDIAEPRIYFYDTALSLSELKQGERFNAQLMVLSACETGVGTNQRGEGVFSLARSFAALGVPSTVTTLWTVENEPTYTLTELFHKYLHDGLPKDEALQRAKLDWLRAGSATDDLPSQWAGIILVGDRSPLVGSRQQVAWIGALAVVLLAGAVWWRRRRLTVPAPAAGRP